MNAKALTVLAAAAGLLVCAAMRADDGPSSPPKWIRTIERRGAPMTKRIAVAIDISGSMRRNNQIDLASQELTTIASLFPDDGYIKVYAFGDSVVPWRKDWTRLPDATVIPELERWSMSFATTTQTVLAAGVVAAVGNPEDDLSVVLISDGGSNGEGTNDVVMAAILKAAKARKNGVPPIHVIGISKPWTVNERDLLMRIAKATDGTFVTWRREDDKPKKMEPGDVVPVPPW